jgi:hypothetical protein
MSYTVVDLGSKKCGALDEFRKKHKQTFGGFADLSPDKFLAVDRNDSCAEEASKRGYGFLKGDVLAPKFEWPKAEYYLAWDFLEHMPSTKDSDFVLRRMVESATRGVWLRMPSFEEDALSRLDCMGLRFTWTKWKAHKSAYTTAMAIPVIEGVPGWRVVKRRDSTRFVSTMDERIVPKGAPADVIKYDPSMGPKPSSVFNPPIAAAIDIVGVLTRVAIPIETWQQTYSRILSLLASGKPFRFNRFGDGEWQAMLAFDPEWAGRFPKTKMVSCGLHGTNANLAEALKETLLSRTPGFFGFQPLAARVMGDAILEWLTRNGVSESPWLNSDVFHYASVDGRLKEFVTCVRSRPSVLVGPAHIAPVKIILNTTSHVMVPDTDCWSSVDLIQRQTSEALRAAGHGAIALVSAGPTAKVLIHRLSKLHGDCSFIDTGAVWDVYVGRKTRSYHQNVNTGQLG